MAAADREEVGKLFSEPDTFTGTAPFRLLLASAIVFASGPGKLSVDAMGEEKRRRERLKRGRAETGPAPEGRYALITLVPAMWSWRQRRSSRKMRQ